MKRTLTPAMRAALERAHAATRARHTANRAARAAQEARETEAVEGGLLDAAASIAAAPAHSPAPHPPREPGASGLSIDERLSYYRLRAENRFALWRPYPKQLAFFALGKDKRERLLRAGNQVGKTTAGAFEATCHLTGRYPDWWPGKRFDQPTLGWIGGLSGVAVRDAAQTKLLGIPGDPSSLGTGMIPKDLLVGTPNASRSAPNGVDSFLVKHITGGNSRGVFKTYEQGAGFWQGPTVDWVWADEEDPIDVHNEALARLTGDGIIFNTLSPLLGYSLLVNRFTRDKSPDALRDRGEVVMTLADAEHFTDEQKARRRSSYSENERSAREFGEPTMGEGAVFTVPERDLRVSLTLGQVPLHWRKIWGIDFGSGHPFGAVLWAFDLDNDIDYILHCIKMTTPPGTPAILPHCDAMRRVAAQVPVAWPHDGYVHERDSGESLADLYKGHGLFMLPEHSTFATGGYSTRAGIDALDQRMHQRKLLVRDSPENEKWFEEYRAYHYKDDKVVKDFDDLMSATRCGYIMRRKARPVPLGGVAAPSRPTPIRRFDLFTGEPLRDSALT